MVIHKSKMVDSPDYHAQYDDYWSRSDRIGESSGDLERTADEIVSSCGLGKILDIGSGEGALVAALLRRGVDAIGLDVSEVVVARCNNRMPGRFVHGTVLSLPFGDNSVDTIVSTDCMEHLSPHDVPAALGEMYRVTGRYVFLKIATTQDRDDHWHLTVEGRAWWETKCFESGFRKHPAYYKINDYEALNQDGWQICVLLEKLPSAALSNFPLKALNEERGLHMDMLRDTGERSDAHVIRYQWASNYIKQGDRVLDAACGLGYGGHVIRRLTHATTVLGIDGSHYAIDYATQAFAALDDKLTYRVGMLPEALAEFPDASFDAIISFETLEHVEDPVALLKEFNRVLSPGGRIIVSVPNDWSDETGQDPNPYHLHVYDWKSLKSQLEENFVLEDAFAQTASQCKLDSPSKVWIRQPRSLRKVKIEKQSPTDCEWWLMVAMKSPLGTTVPYVELTHKNIANSGHPSIQYNKFYDNPWLIYPLVNIATRLKDQYALNNLTSEALASSEPCSNDFAAALCVAAYRELDSPEGDTEEIISRIDEILAQLTNDAMGLRWTVSLLFVKAKLEQSIGRLLAAKLTFINCAKLDVRGFGIHLATKTAEAWFIGGVLAYSLGSKEEARNCWQEGVDLGRILLSASLEDILIQPSFPNLYNFGDGVREYTLAWDNVAQCANGLHLLNQGGEIDYRRLTSCMQEEYSLVNRDLVDRTRELLSTRQALIDRTEELVNTRHALVERTDDLVNTRNLLIERTARLETLVFKNPK